MAAAAEVIRTMVNPHHHHHHQHPIHDDQNHEQEQEQEQGHQQEHPRQSRSSIGDGSSARTTAPAIQSNEERESLEFVAHYEDDGRILSPRQIAQDPRHKTLGGSSSGLRIEDFDLIKTLGTGMRAHGTAFANEERDTAEKREEADWRFGV